jgi:integrase
VVEWFIRDFRPLLGDAGTTWLFPAADGRNRPRSVNTMATAITNAIDEHVGVKIHVHLFRSFAACLLLEHSRGSLNDVRLLLGHKSFETTWKHYAYLSCSRALVSIAWRGRDADNSATSPVYCSTRDRHGPWETFSATGPSRRGCA